MSSSSSSAPPARASRPPAAGAARVPADLGRVYVAGKEINRLASWKVPRLRRQIGTVFQDFRLLQNKNVSENVAFALQVIGKSKSEIRTLVPETLEMVGLEGKGDGCPTSSPVASSSGSPWPGRSSTGR